MKYVVGYIGDNEFIEEELSKYYNPGEEEKISYVNLSDMPEEKIAATSFNGIVYDTSVHDDPKQDELLDRIIRSNDEIDIMPIIVKDENLEEFDELTEWEEENKLLAENYNASAMAFMVNSKRRATIFMQGIFSTMSQKTIRHIDKVHKYMLNSQKNIMNAITKFSRVLELKDPYTEFHSLRVSNYAKQIAISLGLPEEEIEAISQAGELHDIGKIIIADDVLKKPSKLNDNEFLHMRAHAKLGARLLDELFEPGEFEDVKEAVKYHHERFDGKGYPSGLAGEDIPLYARILCIADAFDAMTTKRTYNNPKTLEDAIKDLRANAGTQFDPNLVEIFIDLLRKEPEKLGITIKNGVIIPKYASTAEKEFKEEQIKSLEIQAKAKKPNED